MPLFHDAMETLLDYCRAPRSAWTIRPSEVLRPRLEMIADHYEARRAVPRDGEVPYRPLPPELLYLDRDGWDAMLARGPLSPSAPFAKPDGATGVDGGGRPAPIFAPAGDMQPDVFDQLRAQADRLGAGQASAW